MTIISGKFYWTGTLPTGDDIELAPKPEFSGDFGEQWQYMATEPVIKSVCDTLRSQAMVSEVVDPSPEDHGWYTCFKIVDWSCLMYVQWVLDGDADNCFGFDVRLQYNWYHRIAHRTRYADHVRALRTAVDRALASAPGIEGVTFNGRA